MKSKAYLTGADLEQYEADLVAESELAAKRDAMLARSRRMAQPDADSSDSDEDSDGGSSDASAAGDAELPVEMDFEPSRLGTRRVAGGFAGGAGAWDEFLDAGSVDGGVAQSFDIYVRGKFAKRAVPGAGLERWRMFPVVERKRRVDAWGEAIDVEGWLRRGVEEEDEFTKSAREARERGEVGKRGREEEERVEVRVFSLSGCWTLEQRTDVPDAAGQGGPAPQVRRRAGRSAPPVLALRRRHGREDGRARDQDHPPADQPSEARALSPCPFYTGNSRR